jgi:hypothetical protein
MFLVVVPATLAVTYYWRWLPEPLHTKNPKYDADLSFFLLVSSGWLLLFGTYVILVSARILKASASIYFGDIFFDIILKAIGTYTTYQPPFNPNLAISIGILFIAAGASVAWKWRTTFPATPAPEPRAATSSNPPRSNPPPKPPPPPPPDGSVRAGRKII